MDFVSSNDTLHWIYLKLATVSQVNYVIKLGAHSTILVGYSTFCAESVLVLGSVSEWMLKEMGEMKIKG